MIAKEMRDEERVIHKNKYFISVAPFASRVSYEIRIYPLSHSSRFEDIGKEEAPYFAEALSDSLRRLDVALNGVDYNFFIHSSPVGDGYDHYHWHVEIFPRGFRWAGVELGMGIEVVAVSPEDAAADLKKSLEND
jgi:UDPglucose--hexose-1-phosphate uridylyltransferase